MRVAAVGDISNIGNGWACEATAVEASGKSAPWPCIEAEAHGAAAHGLARGQPPATPGLERRRAQQGAADRVPAAAASSVRGACSAPGLERLWFWQSLLENAAASEVAVNVCLPCCVCGRRAGLWRPPSEASLGAVVLALNLLGCFGEGFCKSTRLLSQTLRHTHTAHQVIFIASQGLSEGFLNVVTSFPDIAGSGGSIIVGTDSVFLGVLYCLAHMVGGVMLYHSGRGCGWRCAQRHWIIVWQVCRIWPLVARGIVLAAFIVMLVIGTPNIVMPAGVAAASATASHAGLLPLDLTEPGLQGVSGVRIVYDEFVFSLPPLALGLAVGIFMSVSGAAVGALFCSVLFNEQGRPAARLITNFAATALTIWARNLRLSGQAPDRAASRTFVLLKFETSFCGALSAFSGTVGDVTDSYFGAASEESSLDKDIQKKGWLPLVSAMQNFAAHFALVLMVMMCSAHSEVKSQAFPTVLWTPARSQQWVHEQETIPWQAQPSSEV